MKVALDILLQSGEGQFVEYKGCFDRPKDKPERKRKLRFVAKDIAICLAEFANADGGTLLVGVENSGQVTGFPYSEEETRNITKMAADSWKRVVPYHCQLVVHEGQRVMAFEVDTQTDIYTLTDGRTPYRNNDQTMWLSIDEVASLKKTKTSTLIERTILPHTEIGDLDPQLLDRFRKAVGAEADLTDEDLLAQFDLVVRNGTGIVLTLAACLLFGKPPMVRFHERCGVNFRRFEGTAALSGTHSNEIRDETLEEPLPILIEKTFELLKSQIKVSTKLRDLFFEERPEYPAFAWQEAIINAIAHRNYAFRGNGIEIWMFDDRLEIKSPGLPPEPVTIEALQLRKEIHASRNPRIMRAFKALRLVRERGEGIPRMFEEMEASLLPTPEFRVAEQFFAVTLRNTVVFDDDTMNWLRTFPIERMNNRQRRILAFAYQSGKGYFSLGEYAKENKIEKENAKREIKQLIDIGIVEMVGLRKGAKYYPVMQRGTIEERLREYFARHNSLTNAEYRRLFGIAKTRTASLQLDKLVKDGFLTRGGTRRWARYYESKKIQKGK